MTPFETIRYLKRFGHLTNALEASLESISPLDLNLTEVQLNGESHDIQLVESLKRLQRRAGLTVSGIVDEATRALLATPRCAMPDDEIAASDLVPWNRRNLHIAFGDLTGMSVSTSDLKAAVLAACRTWGNAGVGLTIVEVSSDEDIRFECRPSNDPDFGMTGSVVAHADYPPGASVIIGFPSPPLPCHFDVTETIWSLNPGPQEHDIETVALHEIGHCLGLKHNWNPNSAMYAVMSRGRIQRELDEDDLVVLRLLYP